MEKKQYKIKLATGKTVGPISFDEIKGLLVKNQINGTESTSEAPFTKWAVFSAYPELAELVLNVLEKNSKPEPENATQTLVVSNDEKDFSDQSQEMPTLIDIARLPKEKLPPDLEKTQINLPILAGDITAGQNDKTKIINVPVPTENKKIEKMLPSIKLPGGIQSKVNKIFTDLMQETSKKNKIFTRKISYVLIAILLISFWFSNDQSGGQLTPHLYKKYDVQVSFPTQSGTTPNREQSLAFLEKALPYFQAETLPNYVKAIPYLYRAVALDNTNINARALLANAYMRIADVIPQNEVFFTTVQQLLIEPNNSNTIPIEYITAKVESLLLLQKNEQALELLNNTIKTRPAPELIYQKAKILFNRGELEEATALINKSISMITEKHKNPRYILLLTQILEQKEQKDVAIEDFKQLISENKEHAHSIYAYANFLFRHGEMKKALQVLALIINKPNIATTILLSDTFVLAAKVYEATNDIDHARLFVNAAKRINPINSEIDDLLYRILSKQDGKGNFYKLILSARQKEKANDLEAAINFYLRARELNREDPTPLIYLGDIYKKKGDIDLALERYKQALMLQKKKVEPFLKLAEIYVHNYDFKNAETLLEQAAELKQDRDQILYLNGEIAWHERAEEQANLLFNQAVDILSRNPKLYIDLAKLKDADNKKEVAEFYYSVALRYDPLNADALLGLALSRFYLDSPTMAISFLKEKLKSQPNSAPIMTNLAIIFLKSGDKDSGKSYLQNAIRIDPQYATAFKLMGDLAKEEGDKQSNIAAKRKSYRFALASYAVYSKLNQSDPDGYMASADLFHYIRDLGAAAKNYYKVLSLAPSYPRARLELAKISRNGGDLEKAQSLVEEEIKYIPRSAEAYVELGNIYLAKNEHALASSAFTKSASLEEKNVDAILGLSKIHLLHGSSTNAIALLQRALAIDPFNPEIHWGLGIAFEMAGNTIKACEAYKNYRGFINNYSDLAKVNGKLQSLGCH